MNAVNEVKIATSPEELSRIYIFRYAVYVEEMGFPFPMKEEEKKMIYDECDKSAINFYIENEEDEIVGIFRFNVIDFDNIMPQFEERYSISSFKNLGLSASFSSKFMIHQKYRGGCSMFHLLRRVFSYGVSRNHLLNFLDCSPELMPFYERLGYTKYYKNFTDPILGEKVPMVLFVTDFDRLSSGNKSLYKLCIEHNLSKTDHSEWLINNFKIEEYA